MTLDQPKETPVSDSAAAETVNSALEQLHLDDVETPQPVESMPPNPPMQNSAQSHMFPPPQMYGFMPYSQMMHMPHPSGFFHPPEFQDGNGNPNALGAGMPAMFNNSNDASMFPVMGSAFQPLGPGAQEGDEVVSKDPFMPVPEQVWNVANDNTATSNVIDSIAKSSAIADEASEEIPAKLPGANTSAFRRQTFHAISTNGLVDPTMTGNAAAAAPGDENAEKSGEQQKTRTQSISYDREGNVESSTEGDKNKANKDEKSSENQERNGYSANYAAAYPYGGPPLQANPVVGVAGHQPPHSAYGVRSPFPGPFGEFGGPFQSFSPNMGGPTAPMHPHSPIPMPHSPIQMGPMPDFMKGPISGDGSKSDENVPILPQGFPVLQHQQGGTPPPWLYNNPAFNGMMPHSPVMAQGPPPTYGRNKDHDKNDKNHYNNRNRGRRNHHYYNNEDRQRKIEDASRYANATLDEFIGNIYSLCKDQHGCRFLQKQLDLLGEKASDAIFEETKQYTIELMTDSFGNYLIQKLLERVNNEQRIELATIAAPKMVEISKDPHGTRALQKLIECISTKEEATIVVNSLKNDTVELSKDLNGNHVIQKCLQKLKPEDFQFIFDAAGEECGNIATHRHGCCVLQRCLDHGSKQQFKELGEKLLKYVDKLTIDPFGNYVVQYIISKETERNDYDYTYKIVNLLKPKFTELSVHKFGSNVVEKILRTPVVAETMINELINEGESEVQTLLNDSYGNYVLQTALDISRDSNNYMYKKLVDLVSPLLVGPIRNTPHGKRIMGILHIE